MRRDGRGHLQSPAYKVWPFSSTGKGALVITEDRPTGVISDFAMEIGHLAKQAHLCLPIAEQDLHTIGYLVRILGSKALQKHLVTANTSTIASTVLAIEGYLAIDNAGRPACKATGEAVGNDHLGKVVSVLSTQTAVLASQPETMADVMTKLETLEPASKGTEPVRMYSEMVKQPYNVPGLTRVIQQPISCFLCGVPHMKSFWPKEGRRPRGVQRNNRHPVQHH